MPTKYFISIFFSISLLITSRIWVVEMRGFMPNLAGLGDTVPNGRISILEDMDSDGIADHSKVAITIKNKQEGKMNFIYVKEKVPVDARTNGLAIFRNTCATCHGNDGDGIEHIAPPLSGSQYVEGSSERLAMILLNGLEGPVHIKGQLYHFNGSMPNFGNNYSDKQIADIISYLHNAFVTTPTDAIHAGKIKELRNTQSGTLTEKYLLAMPDQVNAHATNSGSKTSMTAGKNNQSKKTTL